MNSRQANRLMFIVVVIAARTLPAFGQRRTNGDRLWASNVIMPQAGALSAGSRSVVRIDGIQAGTVITEQVAETTLEISPTNAFSVWQEAELLVPVPDGAVRDVFPKLNDLYEGDQLVVLGIYKGIQPLSFELNGSYLGRMRKFNFVFGVEKASIRNSYVPRLWATRKIGFLFEEI
jgi:hypothetical protein